jgi:serine/threonine protein kinase
MVGDYGQVLVLDWGLALSLRPGPDGRHLALPVPEDGREVCAGTLGFLPPEIATGRADLVGTGTDVFLLGATLYCVLTGESPFEGVSQQACLHAAAAVRYVPARERNPSAPPALVALQQRAMQLDPPARDTVGDFARELRGWMRGGRG